ncbi:hypothetical protein BwSH20_00910 [Bradyrhizobium ottawaense]|nr:hypothetical protein SG09_21530 [Bradyrhizobium ottawaense]GMO24366.1 hypothetical protein BwSH14_22500 [Bradyrhizobium ottawaense]GMO25790.1 hypothetical protein BwSF21_23960 [Bradyrhizobium ottawaense]GMO26808.1 hypothetical protein BwSF12_22950 [Bradyrhizobium ottawaense]GMO69055.1 hypothetical protein BwSF19_04860 [Bradyrhizobium ottawaense]
MTAPPKAISQGSKAGGGGAFNAFTRKSAAKAEPVVTIASAVANKATFFISIPIASSYPVGSRRPPGANDLSAKLRYCDNLD